jgi:hypothetical protein
LGRAGRLTPLPPPEKTNPTALRSVAGGALDQRSAKRASPTENTTSAAAPINFAPCKIRRRRYPPKKTTVNRNHASACEISGLDEDACSYTYSARRDGMELVFTIFPLAGDVYVDVLRDGVAESIIKSRLRECTHSRFVRSGDLQCLEIGRPRFPTSEPTAPLSWGLRLAIDPHLKIDLINERG